MSKKISKLEEAKNQLDIKIDEARSLMIELGTCSYGLFNDLRILQSQIDDIRHVPHEEQLKYQQTKDISQSWYSKMNEIVDDYNSQIKIEKNGGIVGAGIGVGIAAMGPTAAMGIATTFGVASTGTAISSLSGVAATNAALAWLGGGALAAGGGGMAAGSALISLAGPVGWTIAGVALIGSGIFYLVSKSNRDTLEKIFLLINTRDKKRYDKAIAEYTERIIRVKHETELLNEEIKQIGTYGVDYMTMTEKMQYNLINCFNQMQSSTSLLVNPIMALQADFSEEDFEMFFQMHPKLKEYKCHKNLIIGLVNLLYLIRTTESERKLLAKTFRKNKEFCDKMKLKDGDVLNDDLMNIVQKILNWSYNKKKN
jgi:hypothetical protein